MKILQTKGIVTQGQITVKTPVEIADGEVEIIIVAPNQPSQSEILHQRAKANGYDTQEKILELIKQLKLEMLAEKGRLTEKSY
jgi:hypothetical protein